MNHLINVTKKELRELFTPGAVASVVFIIVMFVVMGQAMSGQSESVSSPANIGVVYEDDPDTVIYSFTVDGNTVDLTYRNLLEGAYTSVYGTATDLSKIHILSASFGDDKAIEDELSHTDYKYALAIPESLKESLASITPGDFKPTVIPVYYVYTSGGLFSSASSTTSAAVVNGMSTMLSQAILINSTPYDPIHALPAVEHPVVSSGTQTHTLINGKVYTNITPLELHSTQMGQTLMIPIIVMLVISMVGSVVITSMGSEKENKTLETLLTMPVRRTVIVSGKLLAAAVMGLFYGVCYLIGMMFYSNGMTSGLASVNLNDFGLGMTPMGWVTLFVILFLAIFSALGICMILGAFTKNYKMAQTMVMPVTIMAIIPMMVMMFSDWNALPAVMKGIMFAIPFSHPMMAMNNIVLGDATMILGGIGYLAVLDAVLIVITVRLYNSDILITGLDQAAIKRKLKIPQKKRN